MTKKVIYIVSIGQHNFLVHKSIAHLLFKVHCKYIILFTPKPSTRNEDTYPTMEVFPIFSMAELIVI